jgi:hypothetical protein
MSLESAFLARREDSRRPEQVAEPEPRRQGRRGHRDVRRNSEAGRLGAAQPPTWQLSVHLAQSPALRTARELVVHGAVLTTAGVGARVADVRNAPAPAVRTLTRSRFVAEVSLSGLR